VVSNIGWRLFVVGTVLWSCSAQSSGAQTSKQNVWLPTSQKHHMDSLLRAVEIVQTQEKCVTVVRGELKESQSTPQRPVFRIICRDEQSLTYATLIDGVSLKELHATGETLAEQNLRHVPQYSRLCLAQLKKEANSMLNPHWPEGVVLEPTYLDDRKIQFEVDFTAENLEAETLYYRGYCDFRNLQRLSVTIKPRPKDHLSR